MNNRYSKIPMITETYSKNMTCALNAIFNNNILVIF